jgi:hypothetical protein
MHNLQCISTSFVIIHIQQQEIKGLCPGCVTKEQLLMVLRTYDSAYERKAVQREGKNRGKLGNVNTG